MINIQKTVSKLTILLWNANGVSQHKNEVEHLLYEKKITSPSLPKFISPKKQTLTYLATHYTKPTILVVMLVQAPQYLFLLI